MATWRRGVTSPQRRQCVNCWLLVPRNLSIHDVERLPDSVATVLRSWVTPTLVISEHIICNGCLLLIQERIASGGPLDVPAYGHESVCFVCGISTLRSRNTYRVRSDSAERNIILQWTPTHLVSRLERVCGACWRAANRAVNRQQQHDLQRPIHAEEEPRVEPPPRIFSTVYKRAASTANHCLFLNCHGVERLSIPLAVREMLLLNFRFYVPLGARICHHHLNSGTWSELTSTLCDFTAQQFDDIMSLMENAARYVIDFNNINNMPPALCHYWLGMDANRFNELLSLIPSLNDCVPSASLALAIYLVKLRTGDSNERLSTLFNKARSTLEHYMDKARDCLSNQFVPANLGFNHISIQDVASRNRIIPDALFGNPELPLNEKPAIVICDATYIFVQNSSNYKFQKESYSLQKLDNLVKPFMIVCCDGYIIDCLGPYKATINDATITSINLNNEEHFRSFFRSGDIFILDKGFRDVIQELQSYGFVTHMPESVLENEFQLTTIQANRSRFVTMCRWVVEIINGRIKRDYRLFRHVYNNRSAPHLKVDLRIACALINKYHVVIEDHPDAALYASIAKARLFLPNHLSDFVNRENMNRRSINFQRIDGNHPQLNSFPKLSIEELKIFALGTYQIKQAVSYYGEHVRHSGTYIVEINQEVDEDVPLVLGLNNYLLRGRIRSRHISSRTYYVYLLISNNEEVSDTLDAIVGYCCSCRVGRRTVGCCAHVMTVVWYLSWGRYNDINAPAPFLDNFFDEYEED